jgi:hypothetical protein
MFAYMHIVSFDQIHPTSTLPPLPAFVIVIGMTAILTGVR